MTQGTIAPVRRSVTVACEPQRAFDVFTSQIGSWWPLRTHSLGGEQAVDARFETKLGGRVYEVLADGGHNDWGEVSLWEPPSRFAVTWRVHAAAETTWEVAFVPAGDGRTRVELEHRGWEALGEFAEQLRSNYEDGWASVLAEYERAANTA